MPAFFRSRLQPDRPVPGYVTTVIPVEALSPETIARMAALYLANYDGSSLALFRADLAGKDEAILLFADAQLVGFTTLKYFSTEFQGRSIRVVYSGDTIVAREHWGQQRLAFAWIARMGECKRRAPDLPLYWFLLVKGHRTYKYLSAFGKTFHPHWRVERNDLRTLADQLAATMFGSSYDRTAGVVVFPESRGHLKPGIASPSAEEAAKPGTRFFLARNPGYRQGNELVCLCELELSNMKPLTARIFSRAQAEAA